MIKVFSAVLISLFFLVSISTYLSSSDHVNEKIIEKLRIKYSIPGVAVAVIDDGKVDCYCLGYADIKNKKIVSSETIFQLGSIAKPMSALCSFKLIEKHGYHLKDSIEKVLTTSLSHPDQLTFEKLLSHTSGLNYLISYGASSKEDDSKKLLLDHLQISPNINEKFSYTAAGYYLLQLALEKLERNNITNLLQENLLAPLNLNNTAFNWPDSSNCAIGYSIFKKAFAEPYYHEKTVGALSSNLRDMSKFVESFWNGELKKIIGEKHYNQINKANKNEYHLGFGIKDYNGTKYLSHHGTNRGWNTYFGLFPNKKKGIVILTNSDWGLAFVDHLQMLWLGDVINHKQFYAFTLPNLSVDFSIAFIAILLFYIIFKWRPKRKQSIIKVFAVMLFLSIWYLAFYTPYLVIRGWVIAPYFPWRFQYLSVLILACSLSFILKPSFTRIKVGDLNSLEK